MMGRLTHATCPAFMPECSVNCCAPHQLKVPLLMWIQMLQGRRVQLLLAICGSAAKG